MSPSLLAATRSQKRRFLWVSPLSLSNLDPDKLQTDLRQQKTEKEGGRRQDRSSHATMVGVAYVAGFKVGC